MTGPARAGGKFTKMAWNLPWKWLQLSIKMKAMKKKASDKAPAKKAVPAVTKSAPAKKATPAKKVATKKTPAKKAVTAPAKKTAVKKKALAKKPVTKAGKTSLAEVHYHDIEKAAYYLAEQDGFQSDPLEYWLAAQRQLGDK